MQCNNVIDLIEYCVNIIVSFSSPCYRIIDIVLSWFYTILPSHSDYFALPGHCTIARYLYSIIVLLRQSKH